MLLLGALCGGWVFFFVRHRWYEVRIREAAILLTEKSSCIVAIGIASILGTDAVPAQLLERLADRSEGSPLDQRDDHGHGIFTAATMMDGPMTGAEKKH